MGERRVRNAKVRGSIPLSSTNSIEVKAVCAHASRVAVLVPGRFMLTCSRIPFAVADAGLVPAAARGFYAASEVSGTRPISALKMCSPAPV